MASEDEHDGARRGVRELTRSMIDHGADYAEARLELAKLEAEEAGEHLRGLSVRLGVGIFATVAGYTIFVIAGLGWLSQKAFGGRWEIPTLIVGGLHLFVGILFLLGARRQGKLAKNLFSSTRRELSKDQLWLKQRTNPKDPAEDDPS